MVNVNNTRERGSGRESDEEEEAAGDKEEATTAKR